MATASDLTAATPVSIVFYRDKLDRVSDPQNATWGLVVRMLTEPEYVQVAPCTRADGPKKCAGKECEYKSFPVDDNPMAWVPVEIEGNRLDKNVRFTTLLALDFDSLSADQAQRTRAIISQYEWCWHTTHNHDSVNHSFRVVLALSRKVEANDWHRFLRTAVEFLNVTCSVVDKKGKPVLQPDRTCKDRARLFYRPSRPIDALYDSGYNHGSILDVDAILATVAPEPPRTIDSSPLPEERSWDLEGDAVVGAIEAAKKHFPASRRHEFCMALGGMLRHQGATEDDAYYIVHEIASLGGSTNPRERAKTVHHTYGLSEDAYMTGFTRIGEIVGEDAAREIGDFISDAKLDALDYLKDLDTAKPVVAATVATAVPIPHMPPTAAPIDLAAVKQSLTDLAARRARSLERDDRIEAVILRRALSGKPLAKSGGVDDVETVFDDAQTGVTPADAVRRIARAAAYAAPPETPWEALGEVFRVSLTGTPDVTSQDAERAFKRAQRVRAANGHAYVEQVAAQRAAVAEESAEIPTETFPSPDGVDWQKKLIKGADGVPTNAGYNVYLILRNHPEFCGNIRYNKALQQIEVRRGTLKNEEDEDDLATAIEDQLSAVHGIIASRSVVEKRIKRVANKQAYDPVADYLLGLKWDKQTRLASWLAEYCGVANDDSSEAVHARAVGKRWLIAAVARALKPGCKVDTMLILESTMQGQGKSSAFRALGGDWFCETPLDVHSKDSRMLVGHNWIFEMAELQGFRTADFDDMKAFLSQQEDWVRVPYAKSSKKTGRRAIFGGTTNRRVYFTDDTGNRRYWSVYVPGKIKVGALRKARDQLFAEAVFLFLGADACDTCAAMRVEDSEARCSEHRWWLTDEEEHIAEEEASKREEAIPWMIQITEWWLNLRPHERPNRITGDDIAIDVLNIDLERITDRLRKQIGIAMNKIGFTNDRVMENGLRLRYYYPTQELAERPHVKKVDRITKTLFGVAPKPTAGTNIPPVPPVKN